MAYIWLTANDIIDLANAVISKDGTAACPYFGRAHLYSGPRYDIHEGGSNIFGYDVDQDNNHERAKILAPLFGAKLINDMNVSKLVLENVDGRGMNVYEYIQEDFTSRGLPTASAFAEADRVMRHVSGCFIDDINGEVTTSVIGAGRDRIFFDTEYKHMAAEAHFLVKGIAKAEDIEIVNDGSVMEIRKLYKLNAIELGFRVIGVNEIDKLNRLAWARASKTLMRHCLDVQEFYMIDRQKMWRKALKEILGCKTDMRSLIELDRKLNEDDRRKKRSPDYCFGPAERLSDKEQRLLAFVVTRAATATP